MGKISEENFLEMAEKVLALPKTKDKVVCFVSDWERHKLSKFWKGVETRDREYMLKEEYAFSLARSKFLHEGCLSFILFSLSNNGKISKNNFKEIDPMVKMGFTEMQKWARGNPQALEGFRSSSISGGTDKFIGVLEDKPNFRKILENNKNVFDQHQLKILCLDYAISSDGVLFNFIRYADRIKKTRLTGKAKEIKIEPDLSPLYEIFNVASKDVGTFYLQEIIRIVEKIYSKEPLSVDEMDEINFLSANHLQEIDRPPIWNFMKSNNGYLCEGNLKQEPDPRDSNNNSEKISVRFFYSLSSLLFWELLQCINSVRRCDNCNEPLPAKRNGKIFKGKNCIKGMRSFSVCNKERLRKRQKEFKINLENFS